MKTLAIISLSACWLVVSCVTACAAESGPTFSTPESAATDPDFSGQGEFVTDSDVAPRKGVQVVAQGQGEFLVVLYTGGLPGEGWDGKAPQTIEDEDSAGVADLLQGLQVKRVDRSSPTLGAAPPAGATVLFDGQPASLQQHWQPGAKLTPEGFLSSGATSKDLFQDYTLHVEFRTPFMPQARGQARGNSGVYHQGRYETQVLDSFGLKGLNNETGGIYTVRDPDLNMCFPPLSWQTYDVDFTAPRFDDSGKKTANARMTVRLNGVVVQRDVEVPEPTRAAPLQESPQAGPIYLQDHGNPVAFRNVWVVPRNADLEARRPRLPGYERFLALADRPLEGGLILMGELGCTRCHAAEPGLQAELLSKQGPDLTDLAQRVNPDWLMEFVENPHAVKPGTTMPALFDGWSDAERQSALLALGSFLIGEARFSQPPSLARHVVKGEQLFHTIGCAACHAPQNGTAVPEATSVSLTNIARKYSVTSLSQFLLNPHAVRPSGRMPALHLQKSEAEEIAHYLLRQESASLAANVRYRVYEGQWDKLPNFDELTPVAEGECLGFDLSKSGRTSNFGMRFEGYLPRLPSLTAIFGLGSDDGSRLIIDGVTALEADGIHPFQLEQKTVRLNGVTMHHVRVDYFEQAGEEELVVEYTPKDQSPTDLGRLLQLNPQESRPTAIASTTEHESRYQFHPELVTWGRELFSGLGCANCHTLKRDGQAVTSTLTAKPLRDLNPQLGCLSNQSVSSPKQPVPMYDLAPGQQRDLRLAIAEDTVNLTSSPQQRIERTLTTFNCYACHQRQGMGGPEASRNALFETTEHEMGDEGRLPPALTGVGDKLQDAWLNTVLDKGARNRPYMLTRMPSFGGKNLGPLAAAFIAEDRRTEATPAEFEEPLLRIKSAGRQLVGNGGLACIKCHNFGDKRATGIQAISLTEMTGRIREDWFLRYLFDPVKYRPGTRMPTGFPNGQAVVRDLFHGDPNHQISAIWTYLQDGDRAGLPEGLVASVIELTPDKEPILYRNFLAGASPRGIAVGYPEKVNLVWDLNELCLRQAWHDRFIDASRHWTGRGQGQQGPLGDHIISLEPVLPLARLATIEQPWPTESPRQQPETRFLRYQLNNQGQPTFEYRTSFGEVADFPQPVAVNEHEGTLRRKIALKLSEPWQDLYFRAAVGETIVPEGTGFRINNAYGLKVTGGGTPFIRTSAGKQELLVPVVPQADRTAELLEEILW